MTIQIILCDDKQNDAVQAQEVIAHTAESLHIKTEFDYYPRATDVEKRLLQKREPADI